MSSESAPQCFRSHSSGPSQTWRAVLAIVDTVMGEEGEEVVVEVGEEEDFAVGEGGEEGGLVDAVEGAGFEFTYSVCAYVSVRKFCFAWRRKKEQGQGRREEGGEGRGEEGRREGMRGREKEGEGKAE